ncbi:MAG TPA: carboxypeptidase regulatory-like domain-containing protein [Gammaproteobacteria bacterium]|nr:carboxypeptidase regulatory-like domain-containing protein [Gammaproteobacteria bacterium]
MEGKKPRRRRTTRKSSRNAKCLTPQPAAPLNQLGKTLQAFADGVIAGERETDDVRQLILELSPYLPPDDPIVEALADREEPDVDVKLLLPVEPPPPRRFKGMEVAVRPTALSGDTLPVQVTDRETGEPLQGAWVSLASVEEGECAQACTDADGYAYFVAPSVENPTLFEYAVSLRGYHTFIPGTDPRAQAMLLSNGFTPLLVSTVTPTIFAAISPSPKLKDFEIDQAFGWLQGTQAFDALITKANKKKGWQADDDWWATRPTIYDHVENKGPEDMWTFFGHSGLDPKTNKVKALIAWRKFYIFRGGRPVSIGGLCKHMQKGDGAPGIVVLGACQSADLLSDLIKCCVKVAVGFTKPLAYGVIARGLVLFWEAMLDGKTLQQAISAANARITKSPLNPKGSRMTFKAKKAIKNPGGKKLEEILELKLPKGAK